MVKLPPVKLLLNLAAALFVAGLLAGTCHAAPQPIVSISHKPVALKDLPLAGSSMILTAELQQTRDVDRDVRLLLVRDGKLMDVPLLRSALNERDRPVYEFQLLAPLAEISYQFYLADPSGNAISTPRVTLRRKCTTSTELVDTKIDPNSELSKKILALTSTSEALEQEIKQYEGATQALAELEKLLKD